MLKPPSYIQTCLKGNHVFSRTLQGTSSVSSLCIICAISNFRQVLWEVPEFTAESSHYQSLCRRFRLIPGLRFYCWSQNIESHWKHRILSSNYMPRCMPSPTKQFLAFQKCILRWIFAELLKQPFISVRKGLQTWLLLDCRAGYLIRGSTSRTECEQLMIALKKSLEHHNKCMITLINTPSPC